ncbi:MAG: hypothetical protein AB7V27_02230 [Candidatus Binatia bacterium]
MDHVPRARALPRVVLFFAALGIAPFAPPVLAQPEAELETLKRQMQELIRVNAEQQKQIQQLEQRLDHLSTVGAPAEPAKRPPAQAAAPTPSVQTEIDKALAEVRPPTDVTQPARTGAVADLPALLARRVGGAQLRLIDVSFDTLVAAGWSTENGQTLRDLQGGAHDPTRRGFTLQQGELSFAGAVDPYFLGEAHIVFTDSFVELEEAFITTTSLPYDLRLRGGYFLLPFGRINPTHAHAWTFIDQPVINTRLMGPEGLRSVGAELSWLAPLPWFSEVDVGVTDADEFDLTQSFLNGEAGIGGRPAVTTDVNNLGDLLYLARFANFWEVSDEITGLLGFSGLYGPNSTGVGAQTFIYGTDLTFKWRPAENFRGWPFVVWQTEAMKRDYTADWFIAGTQAEETGGGHDHSHGGGEEEAMVDFPNNLPGALLRDYGFYSYVLWGFKHPWALGLRAEYASGSGRSVMDGSLVSRQGDPFRDDRLRISPLLVYQPSEFSRIRLQYNFDNAKFLPGDHSASSVWLGFEVLYGTHPAHKY